MISVLCPSRGRPQHLARLHRSLALMTSGRWELVVRVDDDDPTADQYPQASEIRYVAGPRNTLSDLWNDCWRVAQGDVFMHGADDIVFCTREWDRLVTDAFPDDGIALVHGDDLGGAGSELATHGFLSRQWTDAVGMFSPPWFSSDWTDTWFREIADALGRRVFVPIVTEHLHFASGKSTLDLTYAERLVRHWKDNVDQIWLDTADERQAWVERLRAVMR